MLRSMRDGAKSGFMKFILMGLMTLAVAGLVLTDAGGFFRDGIGSNSVAKIGRDELPIMTFDQNLRRVLARQGLDQQTAYRFGLINQILSREINQNLLNREARDLGLYISDDLLASELSKFLEPYTKEGISKREAFDRILRAQNMTEEGFTQALRGDVENQLFLSTFGGAANFVSETQAADLYRLTKEEREIVYIELPHDRISADSLQPSDEELQDLYNATKDRFYSIPEKRDIQVAFLTQEQLADQINFTEEELKDAYQDQIDRFTIPEQRDVEQAILNTEADAERLINSLQDNTLSMKKALEALNNSDALVTRDLYAETSLPEDLGRPVFQAEKDDLIGPIETPLGFHILTLHDIQSPKTQAFEDVKEKLETEMRQDIIAEELYMLGTEVDDTLASGESFESIIETYKLHLDHLGFIESSATQIPTLDKNGLDENQIKFFSKLSPADQQTVLQTAFETDAGQTAPVLEFANGTYGFIYVNDIIPESHTPFEDVTSDIRKQWVTKRQAEKNRLDVQNALDTIRLEDSVSIENYAAEHNLKTKDIKLVRNDSVPSPFTPESKERLFSFATKTGERYALMASNADGDGFIIALVRSVMIPPLGTLDQLEFEQYKNSLKTENQNIAFTALINTLYQDYKVSVNQKLLERTYGGEPR